ncbi:homoserine dehydrogenase [Asaia krungthepensis]|uniref:Homoserine dehydrogenase n=1 Tax=Asaia krungthepensis NRIC 0535 TaxID=1307925 RepID=A0ABQ0Q3E7_9PROT|nr:homoserine dehydrogenase [Asaia krungthepensis]GBQ89487.1 homoserine dehydrogenase [Asaia krungthepensis NRIC 0535]
MNGQTLHLGIAGLGTVGAGVVRLLRENAQAITARAGRTIEVVAVSARDRTRDRGVDLTGLTWHDDAIALAADPRVDVVLELIGGAEGSARALVEAALKAGKPVVTANKALLAIHGASLARLARENDTSLLFEASVAGGIPAIKLVREGLAADHLLRVGGILNGTCNYILTAMRETGRDFGDILAEAQALGYAEADPSTDVDGWDAAHKLAILAGLAFGQPVRFDSLHVEGIRNIAACDQAFAREMGYRIKLLGSARSDGKGTIEASMRPCMVPQSAPIANVDGVFNAVLTEGAFSGPMLIEGRGAGAGPTASAVVADVIDLARGTALPVWGMDPKPEIACAPRKSLSGQYYLRLFVQDRPGVVADITAALRDYGVSLRALSQHAAEEAAQHAGSQTVVPLALVTHETSEAAMLSVLTALGPLETVVGTPLLMKIETV